MDTHQSHLEPDELLGNHRWLQRLARGLVAGSGGADDLAQETWLRYLRHAPALGDRPRAWLTTVARNLAHSDRTRDAQRERRERTSARPEHLPSAAELASQAELLRIAVDELNRLDEPYRATLVLRFFHDASTRDIALARGITESTVRTQIQRGLARLRERLDDHHRGDRAAWMAVLAPAVDAPPLFMSLLLGGLLVKTIATVAGAIALTALAWWWTTDAPQTTTAKPAPAATPVQQVAVPAIDPAREVAAVIGTPADHVVQANVAPTGTTTVPVPVASTSIEGLGFVSAGERPLPGARVSLYERDPRGRLRRADWEAIAGARGAFALPDGVPRDGSRSLCAEYEGHAPQLLMLKSTPLIFRLEPGLTVTGFVRDATSGRGMANVAISMGGGADGFVAPVRTAADGSYRVTNVACDRPILASLHAEGAAPIDRMVTVTRLEDGSAAPMDFELDVSTEVVMRAIDRATGLPIAGATLSCSRCDPLTAGADGRFRLRVARGELNTLRVDADGYCGWLRVIRTEQLGPDEVLFPLMRPATVSGRVFDENGQPLIGATLSLMQDPPPRGATATIVDAGEPVTPGMIVTYNSNSTEPTTAEGLYTIANIDPTRRYTSFRIQRSDGQTTFSTPAPHVSVGEHISHDIFLCSVARVSGRVTVDGGSCASAKVTWSQGRLMQGEVHADATGDYELSLPATGEVSLRVINHTLGIEAERTVALVAATPLRVDLALSTTRRPVSGVVLDREGRPVPNVQVSLDASTMTRQQLLTDAHGRFAAEVPVPIDTELFASLFSPALGLLSVRGTFVGEPIELRAK